MLSEAKHLQYLLDGKQMQILRFAQDDSPGTFSAACLGRNAASKLAATNSSTANPHAHNHAPLYGAPFVFGRRRNGKRLILKKSKISLAFGFCGEYHYQLSARR